MNGGMSIVDASTYTNQYQLLISAPTLTTNSTLQTIQHNIGFNQILDLQPIGGSIKLSRNTTALSNLNVSGNTTLNNSTTINSKLNVVGDINTSGLSVFGNNTLLLTKQNNLTFSNPFLNTSNTIF
jgi:hypothetical protein